MDNFIAVQQAVIQTVFPFVMDNVVCLMWMFLKRIDMKTIGVSVEKQGKCVSGDVRHPNLSCKHKKTIFLISVHIHIIFNHCTIVFTTINHYTIFFTSIHHCTIVFASNNHCTIVFTTIIY